MREISSFHYLTQDLESVSHYELCVDACRAGVKWVQFRSKHLKQKELKKQAQKCREVTSKFNAILIVNDYIDIAREVHADGVHLGKEDISINEARNYLGSQAIIGATANSAEDVNALLTSSANYIGCGPFRYTKTKDKLSQIIGLQGYKNILLNINNNLNKVPIIAIGGIEIADIEDLMNIGLDGIAVSGAINLSGDRQKMAKEFTMKMELWNN